MADENLATIYGSNPATHTNSIGSGIVYLGVGSADAAILVSELALFVLAQGSGTFDANGAAAAVASSLAAVATSGAYTALTGRPSLAPVATSGAYTSLTGAPSLAPVATSGAYSSLSGLPTLGSAAAQSTSAFDAAGAAATAQTAAQAYADSLATNYDAAGAAATAQSNAESYAASLSITVSQMNSGTGASSSTFWRGDGTWATPTASAALPIKTSADPETIIENAAGNAILSTDSSGNPQLLQYISPGTYYGIIFGANGPKILAGDVYCFDTTNVTFSSGTISWDSVANNPQMTVSNGSSIGFEPGYGTPQLVSTSGAGATIGFDSSGNPFATGGFSGTFATGDSRTCTVVNGFITNVA